MAEGKRTYRRTPQDIAEAKFISGLIDDFVNKSAKELAEAEKHDELQTFLHYRKTWRGIVADLSEPEQHSQGAAKAIGSGTEVAPGAVATTGTDATTAPTANLHGSSNDTPGGGQKRSSARTEKTA